MVILIVSGYCRACLLPRSGCRGTGDWLPCAGLQMLRATAMRWPDAWRPGWWTTAFPSRWRRWPWSGPEQGWLPVLPRRQQCQ